MYQQYDSAVQAVLAFLHKNGMSKTVHKYFQHDVKVLKEYLERKGLEYSYSVAQARLAAAKPSLTRIAYLSFRRSIALIDEAIQHGEVRTWYFDYKGEDTQCRVPGYPRRLLDEYLARRAREGCQPSTLQMDAIACTRFLLFLQSRGIDDPTTMTPGIIKAYHIQAKHRTHEGKNAYTYRIRSFVRYLAERGLVPETLERSFATEKAPRVTIISILSASQVAAIRAHSAQSSTPSELRSAAMATLALRMGLRSIDICGLRLSDISWEAATISIVQQKTGSPLTLPLPVEVGNTLASYILKGRPACDIPNVFITLKRPYTATTSSLCYRSSVAILGGKESAADIRGLHVARRTFASGLLAAGNPVSMISRALGHSGPSSVDEYLATDVKRMRQCAIGLAGIGPIGALA
jgi:integrase